MTAEFTQDRIVEGSNGGRRFILDVLQGHLMVEHEGDITWDDLAALKTHVWGADARAIEVYPADSNIVKNLNMRHLWRLGTHDFCPDLVGADGHEDSLASRHAIAWAGARA